MQEKGWSKGGRLPNPGKSIFLRLASDAINDVNKERDENGLTNARKAMVPCGMALNSTGRWEEEQLKPELQNIVGKYRYEFENPDGDGAE